MNRSGLISDFLRGIYSGKIVHVYERSVTKLNSRKGDKEYATYQVYLPKKWINKMDTPPTRLVMLETATGDLIILHPETIEETGWAIEGIIKKNNARIDINAKLRESILWKIYHKYRGPWKAADKKRKTSSQKKKDKKNNWRDKVTIGW